jgi:hypothetical protein
MGTVRILFTAGLAAMVAGLGACRRPAPVVETAGRSAEESALMQLPGSSKVPEVANAGGEVAARGAAETRESIPADQPAQAGLTAADASPAVPVGMKKISIARHLDWYGEGWPTRAPIMIMNPMDHEVTNYPVKVTLMFQGGMKKDFSDVRFTSADGVGELGYALESVTEGVQATVRVMIPSLGASGEVLVFVYSGNPAAASVSAPAILAGFTAMEPEPQAGVGPASSQDETFTMVVPVSAGDGNATRPVEEGAKPEMTQE